MAVFKCKMCGAQLTVNPEHKIATCSYCGSTQTIPTGDDEQKVALYNRANTLRLRSSFDEAIIAYQSVITNFPKEAEAYWGLCLSKYGIEYVDDPKTGDKIPTCHRTLYDSILEDPDYLEAVKYSDAIAKDIYIFEAKRIDRIQKRIIRISQKEEPYDIFICYKESDDAGGRTIDSVLAYDIYEKLTEKGYKVFFSRVTLEGKLGQEYEPIIFAALRSAKIMLAVGTKEEYFNAVWVRNEWSRFLSFMEDDPNKYLIPCFKDIDPYDMPEEFTSLQAQDMGKIGYLQDLTHGIDKIFGRDKKVANVVVQQTTPVNNLSGYYTRIESNIKNGQFEKADWLIESVLSINEKDAKSFYYKIFVDMEISDLKYLYKTKENPFNISNFRRAYEYADKVFKEELDQIVEQVKVNKLEERYIEAIKARKERKYIEAMTILGELGSYKNSDKLIFEIDEEKNAYEEKLRRDKEIQDAKTGVGTAATNLRINRKRLEDEKIQLKISEGFAARNKTHKKLTFIFALIAMVMTLALAITNGMAAWIFTNRMEVWKVTNDMELWEIVDPRTYDFSRDCFTWASFLMGCAAVFSLINLLIYTLSTANKKGFFVANIILIVSSFIPNFLLFIHGVTSEITSYVFCSFLSLGCLIGATTNIPFVVLANSNNLKKNASSKHVGRSSIDAVRRMTNAVCEYEEAFKIAYARYKEVYLKYNLQYTSEESFLAVKPSLGVSQQRPRTTVYRIESNSKALKIAGGILGILGGVVSIILSFLNFYLGQFFQLQIFFGVLTLVYNVFCIVVPARYLQEKTYCSTYLVFILIDIVLTLISTLCASAVHLEIFNSNFSFRMDLVVVSMGAFVMLLHISSFILTIIRRVKFSEQ